MTDFTSWHRLESQIPFNDLPKLHRAFLKWCGVENADDMPLRRAGQRVEAELKRLALSGTVQKEGDDFLFPAALIAEFWPQADPA